MLTPLRQSRLSVVAPSLLVAAAVLGCAARQSPAPGGRDERRQEIARLDREIAQQEIVLGVHPRVESTELSSQEDQTEAPGGMTTGVQTPTRVPPPPPTPAREPTYGQGAEGPPGQPEPTSPRFAEPPPGEGEGGACGNACRSVAAICVASRRICRLADGLDDDWADGRCEAATRSCARAERRAESTCGSCD